MNALYEKQGRTFDMRCCCIGYDNLPNQSSSHAKIDMRKPGANRADDVVIKAKIGKCKKPRCRICQLLTVRHDDK